VAIAWWIYVLGFAWIIFFLSPHFLNIFLAYLAHWFELWNFSFGVVVASTCLVGIILFLLPPVPGALVYFFCGALFPKVCPGPHGLGLGLVVAIFMGLVMKIIASIMQQKLIGEALGSFVKVQQQVGIHRPMMRTIEAVLRKPGLSPGKVAILVGGPDWPTSVLCGILRLGLFQIVIGTLPIVGFIAPLTLTGTLLAKASEGGEEGDTWVRWAALMSLFSLVMCAGLLAVVAWAMQDEYEKHRDEFTRPREKDIHLDWLDYRLEEIAKNCRITWMDLPLHIKAVLLTGIIAILGSSHFILLAERVCFNKFDSSSDVSNLQWFGSAGVVKLPGAIALALAMGSGLCLTTFQCWRRAHDRAPSARRCQSLDLEEAEWKRQRLELVQACVPPNKEEEAMDPDAESFVIDVDGEVNDNVNALDTTRAPVLLGTRGQAKPCM
jgi:hypothetical protein